MPTHNGELKLFAGSAHPELAHEIAECIGVRLGRACLKRFSDGEVSFQIDENIRGTDVFVIQPTSTPVDEHLVELCVMIDAFRRSSAARITAVIPYYGYARQDRKDRPRVPISAKLVANLLCAAGTSRVLTMDLHKAQIQGFFDIPVDHLFAAPVFIDYLTKLDGRADLTIVSPDAGGVERARAYAKRLDADLAIIDKRRSRDGRAEVMHVVGEVKGRLCIIQDDIVDTAGTLHQASQALCDNGAASGYRMCRARCPVGSGVPADRGIGAGAAGRDQHDSAADGVHAVAQGARVVGCRPAGQGDPEHLSGDVGILPVCLISVASWRTM